jgi:CspA family cold shock protein
MSGTKALTGGIGLGAIEGRVKWFNDEKGFGFISEDSGARDFFVHWSGIVRNRGVKSSLQQDQKVSFLGWKGDRGFYATEVRPIV